MSGGRPRTPTRVLLMRGGRGALRRLAQNEPVPTALLAEAPSTMTPEEKAVWDETLPLIPAGMLRKLDAKLLYQWCVACALFERAANEVRKPDGLVIRTTNGNIVQSPYVGMMNKASMACLRLGEQLGFTPAARARLGGTTGGAAADQNPFAQHAHRKAA